MEIVEPETWKYHRLSTQRKRQTLQPEEMILHLQFHVIEDQKVTDGQVISFFFRKKRVFSAKLLYA